MAAKGGLSKSALDAAALQQHLAASLGLPGGAPRRAPRRAAPAAAVSTAPATAILLFALPSPDAAQQLQDRLARRWACEGCGTVSGAERAMSCGACGRPRVAAAPACPAAPALTMAQARGLVRPPRAPLSEAEWAGAEARFAARRERRCAVCLEVLGLRETVVSGCSHGFHAACLENLARFLGGSVAGAGSSCPVCREAPMQLRRTRVAAAAHISHCVSRLQAVHRGRLQRRRFFAMRKALYIGHSAAGRPRHAAFIAEALGDFGKELQQHGDRGAAKVDALLGDVDASLEAARRVMQRVDVRSAASRAASTRTFSPLPGPNASPEVLAPTSDLGTGAGAGAPSRSAAASAASRSEAKERAQEREEGAALRLLEILSERLQLVEQRQRRLVETRAQLAHDLVQQREASARRAAAGPGRDSDDEAAAALPLPPPLSASDWATVRRRAETIAERDCAVCMTALVPAAAVAAAGAGPTTLLLSCAHMFHRACLDSLEAFARGQALRLGGGRPEAQTRAGVGGAQRVALRCALCRSSYRREDESTFIF